MIVEAILAVIKFVVMGVIKLLPTMPMFSIGFLDGVFMALSTLDLILNVKVLASCLGILFFVMNAQLIFGFIMWVVRKIPFLK